MFPIPKKLFIQSALGLKEAQAEQSNARGSYSKGPPFSMCFPFLYLLSCEFFASKTP